jgi:hypothetical protein
MNAIEKAERLKLAVQKSGRLTDNSLELLKNCGLKLSRGRDQLMGFGENMPLDVLFVRDDDIPDLVQEDVCDLGLVGRNVLEEKRLEMISKGHKPTFTELRTLEYGRCRLSLAIPEGVTRSHSRTGCANAGSAPTSSRCRALSRSRRGWAAPTSSAISCPRDRRCRPTTCAKSRRCCRARRC